MWGAILSFSALSTITYAAAPEPSIFGLAVSTTPCRQGKLPMLAGVSRMREPFANQGDFWTALAHILL